MFSTLQKKIEKFPQELKEQTRWCNWRNEKRGERTTKIPINSQHGGDAKSNDESTWSDFETTKSRIAMDTGVGYFLKEPYVGIDLDDVEDEVKRHLEGDYEDNIVSEFIHELDSYTEISPSGTGIHIIMKGELPEKGRRRGGIEMYTTGRYFTVTFDSIGPNYIRDDRDTNKLQKLHEKYIRPKGEEKPRKVRQIVEDEMGQHGLDDKEVIKRASRSKNGDKFKDLLNGDWDKYKEYPSQSEADLAFANMLAFWTAKDPEQMDRIVRESGLYREKWDEYRGNDTYGNNLIELAIDEVEGVYSPVRSRTFKPTKTDELFNYNEETLQEKGNFPVRPGDDTGNAQRLIDRYGDVIRYSYNRKKFYVYDGKVWSIDEIGAVNHLVDSVVDSIEDEEWEVKHSDDPEQQEKNENAAIDRKNKHLARSRSTHAKKNMLTQAEHRVAVTPEEFDSEGSLLNIQNGYVDLATGERYTPDKTKMFSMITSIDPEENNEPSKWMQFLNETFGGDEDMINFMQRAVGYSLTGSIREQVMFILHGKGRNGKSIFIETIRDILGTYTNNIQAKTLMVRSTETINNDIAKLQGARMVTSSEPSEGFRFDEGLIKQLTGGDVVTARFLFGEEFDYNPEFKLWLTTNVKPIIKGTNDGIWRRLLLIPFDIQVPVDKVDKDLGDKLLQEGGEILQWAIDGCLMWQEDGLQIPDKVVEASKTYRNEMDPLGQFIQDRCELGDDFEERGGSLFEEYKDWADETINHKMNKNMFGQKMKEKFTYKRKSDGIRYEGLKLKW